MSKIMEALSKRVGRVADLYGRTPREVLRNLYAKRSQTEVAKILGVDQTAVSEALRKMRIAARPRRAKTPKGIVAQVLTRQGRTTRRTANQMFHLLYRTKGLSLQEIANRLGVNVASVHAFAKERNIPLRRVGRPRGKAKARTARQRSYDLNYCI